MAIATANPSTGKEIKTFYALTAETFRKYRETAFADRARWLLREAEWNSCSLCVKPLADALAHLV